MTGSHCVQDMLDKSESFFGKKQKFKLEHKGKTAILSVGRSGRRTGHRRARGGKCFLAQ